MSRLGGAGFSSMPSMYGLGQSGFDAGADRLAQAQRDLSNIILTVSEKRKDRQAARKQQKRAQKEARKNMFTNLGIQAGGAVASGAVLGALPGAEVPGLTADADIAQVAGTGSTGEFLPVTPEQTASMAQVDVGGIGDGGLVEGSMPKVGGMPTGGYGLPKGIPGVNTRYAFGDSLGGSIGKGAGLGLASVFAPGLAQHTLNAPLQAAQIGLGYARVGADVAQANALNDYRAQSLDMDRQQLAGLTDYRNQSLDIDRERNRIYAAKGAGANDPRTPAEIDLESRLDYAASQNASPQALQDIIDQAFSEDKMNPGQYDKYTQKLMGAGQVSPAYMEVNDPIFGPPALGVTGKEEDKRRKRSTTNWQDYYKNQPRQFGQ